MKKLLFSLLLVALPLSYSCEKESCYECKTRISNLNTITKVHCGVTSSEISEIEKVGTYTTRSEKVLVGYTTKIETYYIGQSLVTRTTKVPKYETIVIRVTTTCKKQ